MYRFSLGENEQILKKDTAVLHIEREALAGALYLTNDRIVFVGYHVGASHTSENTFPLKNIRKIKGGKTFFIIPNEIDITLDDNERITIVVHARDEWLSAIQRQMALVVHEPPEQSG